MACLHDVRILLDYDSSWSGGFLDFGSELRPNIFLIKFINISFHICRMSLLFSFLSPGKTVCMILTHLFGFLLSGVAKQCFKNTFPFAPDLHIGAEIPVCFSGFIRGDYLALFSTQLEDFIQYIFWWYFDCHL
jgi:hypothetical protein